MSKALARQKQNPTVRAGLRIIMIRKRKVMLSIHLAILYGVEPRALMQAVRRNLERFPPDFMFQLTAKEWRNLKSQIVISSSDKTGHGGSRALPFAFTELGVAMMSSILNSQRAILANITIMRSFVQDREQEEICVLITNRISALEQRFDRHDEAIESIFEAIREIVAAPLKKARRIGFSLP